MAWVKTRQGIVDGKIAQILLMSEMKCSVLGVYNWRHLLKEVGSVFSMRALIMLIVRKRWVQCTNEQILGYF